MEFLRETRLLDFSDRDIQNLVKERKWMTLTQKERIGRIYDFVRDEIRFGYNKDDEMPSSEILSDGYGQCNTKGILLMSLLRACGLQCRFHGFTINKSLQKGAIAGIWYKLSPHSIVHSWVEVEFEGTWYNLEGFILDLPYLKSLQRMFPDRSKFCGFGAATSDLQKSQIFWEGNDTYIQKEGINHDYGVYPDPDTFFHEHKQNIGQLKRLLFRNVVRHRFNRTVSRIRGT